MYYRNNVLLAGTSNGPNEWGNSHSVMVYKVGAVASANGAAAGGQTTVQVASGHQFEVGDKGQLWRAAPGVYLTGAGVISKITTQIVFDGEYQIFAGDRLICLGGDTGTSTPNYDGSDQIVWRDPGMPAALLNSRVFTDQFGNYSYYINDLPAWEVIRDSNGDLISLLEGNGLIA